MPTTEESRALMNIDKELFTDDAWQGMLRLQQYSEYLEQLSESEVENSAGCELCASNRIMLEKAWQVVANEYYDPYGKFSQAAWAQQLLTTLKECHGVLRTKQDAYQAVHQLIASLHDQYSDFLPPSQFRRALRRPSPAERNYLEAQFVGVGIQFGSLSPAGGRLVEAPLAESPAEAAGVGRGDRVLEIEGIPAEQLTLDETTTLLRGPSGSSVTISLAGRSPHQPPRQLELERKPLPQPAVKDAHLSLPDGRIVSYLRLHYFCHDTTKAVTKAVVQGEIDQVAGYILDLRNDPGGVFEEAVAIATLFLDPSLNIAETVRNEQVIENVWTSASLGHDFYPEVPGPLTSRPVVVLVNKSSASASEVLAGALHDTGRAMLLGERTFGKGVMQSYFPMGDGSGIKLTVAKYLTPSKYDISREGGLQPDMHCSDYPHGVFTQGRADTCVIGALDVISSARRQDPLSYSPLYANTGTDWHK
eukprot:jgi/Chrzof1/10046/Cz04g25070.t1